MNSIVGADWQFPTTKARIKLKRLYPQVVTLTGIRVQAVLSSYGILSGLFIRTFSSHHVKETAFPETSQGARGPSPT